MMAADKHEARAVNPAATVPTRETAPEVAPFRDDVDRNHAGAVAFTPIADADRTDPEADIFKPWSKLLSMLQRKVSGFTPKRKQAAFILFVAVMLWRPWLIPGIVLLSVWIGLIVYFTVGPERISELVISGWERFARRSPDRAERALGAIQRWADRLEGWLARLPETWTDGVYLPDLGRSHVEIAEDGPDPFDRLTHERDALLSKPYQV